MRKTVLRTIAVVIALMLADRDLGLRAEVRTRRDDGQRNRQHLAARVPGPGQHPDRPQQRDPRQDRRRFACPGARGKIEFNIDGHGFIDTKGLPVCTMAKLAGTTPQVARKRCAGAIVGQGIGEAEVRLPGQAPIQDQVSPHLLQRSPQGGQPASDRPRLRDPAGAEGGPGPVQGRENQQRSLRLPRRDPAAGDRRRLRRRHPGRSDCGQDLETRRQDGRLRQRPLRRRPAPGLRKTQLRRRQLLPGNPDLAVPRGRLSKAIALCCVLAVLFAASAVADGALVRSTASSSDADGSFQPRTLPRHSSRRSNSRATSTSTRRGGGRPVALQEAVVDFDRDGRINAPAFRPVRRDRVARRRRGRSAGGLPRARSSAPAGSKRWSTSPPRPVPDSSALTIFNGPARKGSRR